MVDGPSRALLNDPPRVKEDRLRDIFNLQHQFLAVLSPEGIVLEINDLPLKVGGVRREAVVGRPLWEGVWWRDLPDVREEWPVRLQRAAQSAGPVMNEIPFMTGKGELRYALDTLTAVRKPDGSLDYFIAQGHDITGQKRDQAELREKDALLRIASQVSRLGGWTVEFPEGRLNWSDEVCRIHEVPPGTSPSLELAMSFYTQESRKIIIQAFEECLNLGRPYDLELALTTASGRSVWVRTMGEQVLGPDGTVLRLHGAFQDITSQKRAQEALLEGEARFKFVAQATMDAIWDWDIQRDHVWWGDGMPRLFGFAKEELEPGIKSWTNRVHPDDREAVMRDFYESIEKGGEVWVAEYRFLCKDGRVAQVLDRGRIIRDAQGKAIRMVGGMTDLTDQKKAQMELARSNRALKMLTDCNDVLFRATDEVALLSEICRLAVERGGYRMAWVGYAQHDEERTIKPLAHAGEEQGYLDEIVLTWSEDDPRGAGPAGQVIRSGRPVVADDIREREANFCWLIPAMVRGYRSVICLPLKEGERTFGVLALYAGEVQSTGPEEVKLLQELADDLAFGIHHLRSQNERRRMEAAVVKVAASVSASTGTEFFVQLARNMAEALGAHAGFVARLLPGEPLRAQTLAAVVDGEVLKNFEYPLADRPCEHLAKDEVWVVPADVIRHFPNVPALRELQAESYVGCRLVNASGHPIGLLFVIFRESLEKTDFISTTLKIFAARAASEVERKDSDRRIRQQASLLDKARDAILVRDLENHILFWNKSAERLYGWTAAEVMGRDVANLLYKDTAALDAATALVIEVGEWVGELFQIGRDGRQLTIEGRWTLLRDEEGQPQSILAINTDITEKKHLEQQFLRAQRMESIGTLAGGIAHDLNNVLSPITMAVDLLRLNMMGAEEQDLLATIADSARRGASMVRQVLSFARGMEGQRVQIQIKHLLKEVEKITRDTFPKNIRLRTRIEPALMVLRGDPTQLHQVLLNLCVNARDAMPEGGEIVISAENAIVGVKNAAMNLDAHPGPHVVIEVEDTGCGIPLEIIDKVFDPFFTTKEIGKGTGLGLSTSLAIVKSHGGFIRLESGQGVGTRFRIYLPALSGENAAAVDVDAGECPRGRGEQILIVDDEELIRLIARQTLQAYGYRVLLAADGMEALNLYQMHGHEIAAVMTDMMMPVMDGVATIQGLKELNPKVKIIAASGIATNEQLARVANVGVKNFLAKPYTVDVLLVTLRQLLDEV